MLNLSEASVSVYWAAGLLILVCWAIDWVINSLNSCGLSVRLLI